MGKQNNQSLFYALLFFQGLISFVLGIAGNKVAEVTNLPIGILLLGTILLLGISFFISVLLLKGETTIDSTKSSTQPDKRENWIAAILSRVITSFPFGIFTGLVTAAVFVYAIWYPAITFSLSPDNEPTFYLYELLSWIVLIISAYLINQHKEDRAIVLAYSLGFAIGASSSVLALDFPSNHPIMTFLGWLIVSFFTALTTKSSAIKGIMNDISEMFTNVTEKR